MLFDLRMLSSFGVCLVLLVMSIVGGFILFFKNIKLACSGVEVTLDCHAASEVKNGEDSFTQGS